MSRVTTVIVSCGEEPAPVRQALGLPIDEGQALRSLTDDGASLGAWGGPRKPQVRLWGGAFNHVDWDALFQFLEMVPWTEPREVQVLVAAEDSRKLGLFELRRGRLVPTNAEAARQMATLGTDELIGPDGSSYSFREPDRLRPTTAAEVGVLVDGIAVALAPPSRNDLRNEVEFLLGSLD